ncbi:MAG: ribonuclease J [Chloroflexi bacterium]|nr:ribonuclease J [Chloroflexota bacterium]
MVVGPLRIAPLGGVGEFGKNSTLYEYAGSSLLVDAGLKFPEDEMLGVDLVIPSYEYVLQRADQLRVVLLTHAHEDHIGSLPFLVRQLPAAQPLVVAGAPLTLGLVDTKLHEYGVRDRVIYEEIRPGEVHQFGPFGVEFIHVTHSVPDAVALAIRCDEYICVHTGDFKFDPTPLDEKPADIQRLVQLGDEGVLVLLCDTTRIDEPGRTPTEQLVADSLARIMRQAPGRVIVTMFASNITRLRQVVQTAQAMGRSVGIVGRSLVKNVDVAHSMGYMPEASGVATDLGALRGLAPESTVLLTTGSQGEPTSALARMAADDHPGIKIISGDTVVLSASPVPGNEITVSRTINNLYRRGAHVIARRAGTDAEHVHVSGHGSREEIRDMLRFVRPKYCVPLHGEYRNLSEFRTLAKEIGISEDRVILTDIGDVVEFDETGVRRAGAIPSGAVFVDGLTLGVSNVVLRDRRRLGDDGVLVVTITLDAETGELIGRPEFISRGLFDNDSPHLEDLVHEGERRLRRAISRLSGPPEPSVIESKTREILEGYLSYHTRRRPLILPIVTQG